MSPTGRQQHQHNATSPAGRQQQQHHAVPRTGQQQQDNDVEFVGATGPRQRPKGDVNNPSDLFGRIMVPYAIQRLLPTRPFDDNTDTCCICRASPVSKSNQPMGVAWILPCKHAFHRVCLTNSWFDIHKDCPLCEVDITTMVRSETTIGTTTRSQTGNNSSSHEQSTPELAQVVAPVANREPRRPITRSMARVSQESRPSTPQPPHAVSGNAAHISGPRRRSTTSS